MLAEMFGTNVFSEAVMRRYVPAEYHAALSDEKRPLHPECADAVAEAMKTWALERGATHYCHWFQPLTGNTAQKHDSFLAGSRDGQAILRLTGKQLLMGESDASSFPTGGLRETAYARGYTAWDRTSPVFLKEESAGVILCIPTIFISYNGDALDTKTPLLRSMEALDIHARRILGLFSQKAEKVLPFVGAEQEYFLIDRQDYLKRRDLIYCGRTLFGAPSPKGQELDDRYFGTIRHRQGAFMQELNRELWRLGIPAVTEHNEVAPAQHELACIHAPANIAVDQNQLVMETMKRLAGHHGLVCLLHEKPFAGVNGSGKHNNWSIGTDQGENLLDPGKNPESNLRFQLILACILQAVDRHADLLRLSAANPGNDLRLGGQEAPPAIISVYLGDRLDQMVNGILTGKRQPGTDPASLDPGVSNLAALPRDDADRNRTSPFAFTGNKFEFRMVGASDSVAAANTILNTIVAEAFSDAADVLESSENFASDCDAYIRRLLTAHRRILFRGDGYSEAWISEAQKRGLPNLPGMVDAIGALMTQKAVSLFGKFRVYSRSELESRAEVLYGIYAKHIRIEARTMLHMASKRFLPAAIRYSRELAETVYFLEQSLPTGKKLVQKTLLERIQALLEMASAVADTLSERLEQADALVEPPLAARYFYRQVIPVMQQLRRATDDLEQLVSKEYWPVPTYGDLLFEV